MIMIVGLESFRFEEKKGRVWCGSNIWKCLTLVDREVRVTKSNKSNCCYFLELFLFAIMFVTVKIICSGLSTVFIRCRNHLAVDRLLAVMLPLWHGSRSTATQFLHLINAAEYEL